ncbi:MAG: response regulator SirA [Candidatus Hydrogenedentes bacterium]|nr:response regulator SirA [Candidatus Hydrogenedentota bacterium]
MNSTIKQIVKRDGTVVAYDRDRISTAIFKAAAAVSEFDRSEADRIAQLVEQRLLANFGKQSTPSVEEIQDLVEETLIMESHAKTARAYIRYRHDRQMERTQRAYQFEATDNIPYKKIYEVLRWNMDHGCDTVDGLNEIIASGTLPELIAACENRYDKEVAAGAEKFIEHLPEVRVFFIAGPSSSSKTTTTIKVSEKLAEAGNEFLALNIDHYFFDLDHHPKDEFGDYDYETPHALDLKLIDQHVSELLAGKRIKTPHYDFKTGTRKLGVYDMELGKNQILLIDSLHGLFGEMTQSTPDEKKFKLYIETLGQVRNREGLFMRWADNRLLRRMIRDSWHRNLQPEQTLTHWHYVRRSELRNIIPFIGTVDNLVNSAMPYELPILKDLLFKYFPTAMEKFKDEAKRQDAYVRAKRVYETLKDLTPVSDDSAVPKTSLLREFIGGSDYTY